MLGTTDACAGGTLSDGLMEPEGQGVARRLASTNATSCRHVVSRTDSAHPQAAFIPKPWCETAGQRMGSDREADSSIQCGESRAARPAWTRCCPGSSAALMDMRPPRRPPALIGGTAKSHHQPGAGEHPIHPASPVPLKTECSPRPREHGQPDPQLSRSRRAHPDQPHEASRSHHRLLRLASTTTTTTGRYAAAPTSR